MMGFQITGGNVFGLLAPIVTGYVIKLTGRYSWTFIIGGLLLLIGALLTLTMTRWPIGEARGGEADYGDAVTDGVLAGPPGFGT